MIIMGIDPGATGAVCVMTCNEVTYLDPMAQFDGFLADVIDKYNPDHIYLEKAQAMPGNGGAGMFKYATGFGILQGIMIALQTPFTLVAPVTWTKVMHKGCTGDSPKRKSLQAAQRLFPSIDLVLDGCRVPHPGLVDALLIAEFGRRSRDV